MPAELPADAFSDRLLRIFSKQQLTLFAGAGVGRHAGLPDWDGLIEHLASTAAQYEDLTAAIIRARAKGGLLAEAAHYYKSCALIPSGEKLRNLAQPFQHGKYDSAKLTQLVKLPFQAIITTNYDDSLHDAWAGVKHSFPQIFELDDGTLKQASFCDSFFIARIHGKASKPESMVLDKDDFTSLAGNASYTDFVLQSVLARRTCLFLGYSFLDPALNRILEPLRERIGPNYPKQHFAIVPSKATELVASLAQFNIQTLMFENYDALWACIDSLPEKIVEMKPPAAPSTALRLPFEKLRQYLATCHLRSSMIPAALPLRDTVIEGIILSIVEDNQPHLQLAALIQELRHVIPLDLNESQIVIERALTNLSDKKWVSVRGDDITLAREPEKSFHKHFKVLTSGVLDRLLVREGVEPKPSYETAAREALEQIFFLRGWDLGAQLAGVTSLETVDLFDFLRKSLRKSLPGESFERVDRIVAAAHDLLLKPDSKEAQILADVARLCFGLSVLLQSGASAIKAQALPERIYFDSNILMCAITEGHPLRAVYQSILQRLREVSDRAGGNCELLVTTEFINEIVHHRKKAIEMVEALHLENPAELERHISYYRAENTNVFVGSYATWVGREKRKISFREFLASAAPYENEYALQRHLKTQGFDVVEIGSAEVFGKAYKEVLSRLTYSYASQAEKSFADAKPLVLVEHEAKQLAQIEIELERGQHTIFVTADNRLRRIINENKIGRLWNVVMSHFALVGLVELLVGVESDPTSLARFFWGIVEVDEIAALRDFFITRAAKKFDEALLMTLPQFADRLATEAAKKAELEKINFWSRDIKKTSRAAKFLDRLEDEFYANMAQAIRRAKRENDSKDQQKPPHVSKRKRRGTK